MERARQAEASAGEARPAKRPGLLASLKGLGRWSRTASAQAPEPQQHSQAPLNVRSERCCWHAEFYMACRIQCGVKRHCWTRGLTRHTLDGLTMNVRNAWLRKAVCSREVLQGELMLEKLRTTPHRCRRPWPQQQSSWTPAPLQTSQPVPPQGTGWPTASRLSVRTSTQVIAL